ncbi:MAG: redoxin domain-containing protein [Chloroflexia bacterium]|nr:redoxin domain-containing protein [Chloroflexia bacterium]
MRERQAEFDRRGVRIISVTFESETRIREYHEQGRLPFTTLRDPRRAGYKRFGIERQSARKIYSPGTIWYYIKRFLQGEMPSAAHGDLYQLGGDVLLDSDGSALWVYQSQNPADRPSVDDVLREIDQHA